MTLEILPLFFLVLASFFTSIVTAIAGMGGGILLLSILPFFIPSNAIIPIHGIVQLASNSSRYVFGIKYSCTQPILMFGLGSIIGSMIGSLFLDKFNKDLIPLITSLFILLILWVPIKKIIKKIPGKYFTLGIFQTATSLYVGATGPLSTSVLISEGYSSNQVIVTNAGINTILNIFKSFVFFFSGFIFKDYIYHILLMCVFSITGSFVGIRLRGLIKENHARAILKIMITLFCTINIYLYFK
jgi:uncharacterized membrane protein YfcA